MKIKYEVEPNESITGKGFVLEVCVQHLLNCGFNRHSDLMVFVS
jgi:hypothetical protein